MSGYKETLYPLTKIHLDELPQETQELIIRLGVSNPHLLSLAQIFGDDAGYLFQHAPFLIKEVMTQKDNPLHLSDNSEDEVQVRLNQDKAQEKLELQLKKQRDKSKHNHFVINLGDLVTVNAPARIPFNSSIASDKVTVNLAEGSLVLNMSVSIHGERPIVIRVRRIDEQTIRVKKTDIDSLGKIDTVSGEFRSKEKITDISDTNDPLRMVKIVLIVSGIVDLEDVRPLSEILLALGGGLEVEIYHHLAQGGGSSNIMYMSLFIAINRSLGQENNVEELSNNVLLAEYLTGSLGGWNDHLGGYYPGVKEFVAEPGTTFPKVRNIPIGDETRVALEERLILWDSGQVRPSLSSKFKRAIATQAVTYGRMRILRDQARKVHHRMVEALRSGDM